MNKTCEGCGYEISNQGGHSPNSRACLLLQLGQTREVLRVNQEVVKQLRAEIFTLRTKASGDVTLMEKMRAELDELRRKVAKYE